MEATGEEANFPLGTIILLTCLVIGIPSSARAHDPGLSTVELQIGREGLTASLTFALVDIAEFTTLDADRDGTISRTEFDAARPLLETLASRSLEIEMGNNLVSSDLAQVELDDNQAVKFLVDYPQRPCNRLSVRSKLLTGLPPGHRQYVSVRDYQGKNLKDTILVADANVLEVNVRGHSTGNSTFWQFLSLGIEHILTGYDHLLFLLGVLIAGGRLFTAAKIITSFTVAHSITLALAGLNVIHIPSSIVEPLIAVSIVYVGLENMFLKNLERRWLITFAFGLIHGLGFASILRELGIGSGETGIIVPLVSFNVGVELGQIGAAALILPVIWKLQQSPELIRRFAPACSALLVFAGTYWFILRIL